MAILTTLTCINKNPPIHSNLLNIYRDCQVVLQLLNLESFPKYNNIKILIQSIFKTLILIQYKNPNIIISLYKVKSHSLISGNNKIDLLVRNATKTIRCKSDQFSQIPYSVTLTQIHKFLTLSWKSKWKKLSNPNEAITKCHNKSNKNGPQNYG